MSGKPSNRKWFLLASLATAAAMAALGLYLAQTLLCPNQILSYHLIFPKEAVSSPDPAENKKWILEQNIQILLAAQQSLAGLADQLQLKMNPNRPSIHIALKSRLDQKIESGFLDAIKQYCRQATISRHQQNPQPASDQKPDNAWLDELAEKQQDLRDQILALEQKYQILNMETLSLEHRLAANQMDENPEFDDQMASRLIKLYKEDAALVELNQLHRELAVKIADLDLQAGQSRSGEQLRDLDQQREQLNQQLQHVHQRIVERQRWIAQQLFQEFWPVFERKIKQQIDTNHQKLVCCKADLDMLNQSLDRLTDNIDAFENSVQQDRSDSATDQSPQLNNNQPAVEFSLDHFHKKIVLSPLQWAIVITAAIAGLAIGFLAASAGAALWEKTPAEKTVADELPERPKKEKKQKITISPTETPQPSTEETAKPSPALATIDINKDLSDSQSEQPSSGWTDEYDTLAKTVLTLQADTACPVVILSAVNPQESSPRIAVNLAIALARKKCRTLLIEADPASKDLADIFDQSPQPGFYEWRRGEHWASRLVDELPLPDLSFMPAGLPDTEQTQPEFDPARESHRWENLKKNYDAILLFCPAALAHPASTPEQIASGQTLDLADALIAMAKAGRQLESQNQWLQNTLQPHKAKYLGLIAVKY